MVNMKIVISMGIISFVLIFLFFIICSLFLFFRFKNENQHVDNEKRNNIYLKTYLNPSTNKTSYGTVRMNKKLKEDEYLSYFSTQSNSTSIISNFFETKYECTGSCYCGEDTKRRNAAAIFNIGFFVILSAISVSMAYKISKEAFQNDCVDQLYNLCSAVKSDVEKCEILQTSDDDDELETYTYTYEEEEEEELIIEDEEVIFIEELKELERKKERRVYTCHGFCIEQRSYGYSYPPEHAMRSIFPGQNKKEAKLAFGACSQLEHSATFSMVWNKRDKSDISVKKKFWRGELDTYCQMISKVPYFSVKRDTALMNEIVEVNVPGKLGDTRYSGTTVEFEKKKTHACSALRSRKDTKCVRQNIE